MLLFVEWLIDPTLPEYSQKAWGQRAEAFQVLSYLLKGSWGYYAERLQEGIKITVSKEDNKYTNKKSLVADCWESRLEVVGMVYVLKDDNGS